MMLCTGCERKVENQQSRNINDSKINEGELIDNETLELVQEFFQEGAFNDFRIYKYEDEYEWISWNIEVISRANNSIVQEIELSYKSFFSIVNIEELITEYDVTFDGKKDILIYVGVLGTQMAEKYLCYVWDDNIGRYTEAENYSSFFNPAPDDKEQVILSFGRNSASETEYFKYRFIDGTFVCIAKLYLNQIEEEVDGKYVDERLKDGTLVVYEEGILDLERYNLFKSDGYWELNSDKWFW